MAMRRRALGAVGAILLTALPRALAEQPATEGGASPGNLSADFYARPNCEEPGKWTLPKPNYNDREGLAQYNQAVRRYVSQSKAFDSCVSTYVDKASNDIDWIIFTVNTAVARANGASPPAPPATTGNMATGFYPSAACVRPDSELGTPPATSDTKAMNAYNVKVAAYNALATRFNDCLNDYRARAKSDIERIEEARKDAALQGKGDVSAPSAAIPATQVSSASLRAQPLPAENITVTEATSRPAVEAFAKALSVPTKLTGKIARWERGVCPIVLGQKPDITGFIGQRLKYIALAAGAPVNTDAACAPNIEIVFTSTPQSLLDGVRKDNPDYLGYATTNSQRDTLASVSRPIQAWYETETVDRAGKSQIDSGRRVGTGITMPNFTAASGTSRAAIDFPDATYARVTGNHINDGSRSAFHHILIVLDSTKLTGQTIAPLADYISLLALTQSDALDTCQELSSIVNLMASACDHRVDGITRIDLAYLQAVYQMGSDKSATFQQNDITDAMMDRLEKGN